MVFDDSGVHVSESSPPGVHTKDVRYVPHIPSVELSVCGLGSLVCGFSLPLSCA